MMKEKQKENQLLENAQTDAARSEIQEYLDVRQLRRWIFPRAALVGALAGLIALLFRAALIGMDNLRNQLIELGSSYPYMGWMIPLLFTALGAVIAVILTKKYAPEASGSGIPHLEAVLHRLRVLDWRRVLPIKFFGGILAIGGGLALGREGPTVQMGGAVGDAVSKVLKVSPRERRTLIAAGAGAGLAAAFNAPLSGLVFVLEEVRRDFQPIVFGAAFVAAVIADIVARIGAGPFPVFTVPSYPNPPLQSLVVFAVLGIVAGVLGVLFNRGLLGTMNLYERIPEKFSVYAVALTGAIVGLIAWFSPISVGSGHHLAESALKGELLLGAIPLFFVVRFVLTTTSYSTGSPGGIFAPLLVLGALIGLAVGMVTNMYFPTFAPIPAVFAVVGMAAYFTAIVRAPLTGIMLIVEMTGNYALLLPLLASCFCAYAVAEYMADLPIYESLLERDLNKNGATAAILKVPAVVEYIIQEGAPFIGKEIRTLGLPAGCILVRVADGQREWVPKANTRLQAHMRLTAVIAPEAADSINTLRHGCELRKI